MTEQDPARLPLSPEDAPGSWEAEPIAEALGVPAEPRVDQLFGESVRFRVGPTPGTEVEIFPAARTVRITGDTLALSLFQQAPPTLTPEGVLFDHSTTTAQRQLSVSADGTIHLVYEPNPQRHRMPQDTPLSARQRLRRLDTDDAPSDDSVAPNEAFQIPPDDDETKGKEERIRLAGRLGTNVRFRTTRSGKTIASFALAIREDDGSTRWQDVLLFNERAEKLRSGQAPQKGQYCEVVGYRHEKEVKGKDGKVRTVEEIYAVAVKPR